jgi:hypothetical protein
MQESYGWDMIPENAIPCYSGVICKKRQRLEVPSNEGDCDSGIIRPSHCSYSNKLMVTASQMKNMSGKCRLEFILHTLLITFYEVGGLVVRVSGC